MKAVPRTLWALFSVLLFAPFAAGQGRDEYGEIHQTVARISLLSGEVSFARGDDPDNWQPADRNVPMTLGDRVYTGSRSRLELQLQGGDFIRLGARTDLAALNLTDDTKQLSLKSGIASIQIRRLSDNEIFEVDTPNAAVTFDRSGEYRVDVDANGYTRVSVRRGSATVAAGGGQIPVEAGEAIDIDGIDSPHYDIVSLSRPDDWDRWVSQREDRQTRTRSPCARSAIRRLSSLSSAEDPAGPLRSRLAAAGSSDGFRWDPGIPSTPGGATVPASAIRVERATSPT